MKISIKLSNIPGGCYFTTDVPSRFNLKGKKEVMS